MSVTVTLIGATTESVSHNIIPPFISRCRVYRLERLQIQDLEDLIHLAMSNSERGLAGKFEITDEALNYLCDVCNGDICNAT